MDVFAFWIISPDRQLSDRWQFIFGREGWSARALPSLAAASEAARGARGLLLLEIPAPEFKSPETVRKFAEDNRGVSLIGFGKSGRLNNNQIAGFLEAGMDDFISAELDEKILLAKIKAHLRRLLPSLAYLQPRITSRNKAIEIDKEKRSILLDPGSRKAKALENLTPKEFDILSMLVSHETQVVSREMIMEMLWGDKVGTVNSETVDKHIESIRRKLGACGKRIKTVYGAGYVFKDEAE